MRWLVDREAPFGDDHAWKSVKPPNSLEPVAATSSGTGLS